MCRDSITNTHTRNTPLTRIYPVVGRQGRPWLGGGGGQRRRSPSPWRRRSRPPICSFCATRRRYPHRSLCAEHLDFYSKSFVHTNYKVYHTQMYWHALTVLPYQQHHSWFVLVRVCSPVRVFCVINFMGNKMSIQCTVSNHILALMLEFRS